MENSLNMSFRNAWKWHNSVSIFFTLLTAFLDGTVLWRHGRRSRLKGYRWGLLRWSNDDFAIMNIGRHNLLGMTEIKPIQYFKIKGGIVRVVLRLQSFDSPFICHLCQFALSRVFSTNQRQKTNRHQLKEGLLLTQRLCLTTILKPV